MVSEFLNESSSAVIEWRETRLRSPWRGVLRTWFRSGTEHFDARSISHYLTGRIELYKGGWEICSIQNPRVKKNGVIFVTGPHSGRSAGTLLKEVSHAGQIA